MCVTDSFVTLAKELAQLTSNVSAGTQADLPTTRTPRQLLRR